MNPIAQELNDRLRQSHPNVFAMLSELGRRLYFPKGILSQGAEAKAKAHLCNATVGIATQRGGPMHLPCVGELVQGLDPAEIYLYAPPDGRPELRDRWREKMLADNPGLEGKRFGSPIVTCALTHGLSLTADLFADPGDALILPDKLWGNYRLIFETRRGADLLTYPLYSPQNGFNVEGLAGALRDAAADRDKLILILNFPNNPTGFTPSPADADGICEALRAQADAGTRLVVICDDAYFGLFYEDDCLKESIFARLADTHENILAIKLDGATKEHFVWGLRVGFITYGPGPGPDVDDALDALLQKTKGAIRSSVSNGPNVSQSLVAHALVSPDMPSQKQAAFETLRDRAAKVKEVLANPKYADAWTHYPFNSGYFMCLRLADANAEELRVHLLDNYGVGVIASGDTDIRVAFSCLEADDIEPVFEAIYEGVRDLRG